MTDREEIGTEELDWEGSVVHDGRQAGSVVSVRLDAVETARLRRLADGLGLNVSQVLRRALADFQPQPERRVFVAFTHGGSVPSFSGWRCEFRSAAQLRWPETSERCEHQTAELTSTELTRIVERVTA